MVKAYTHQGYLILGLLFEGDTHGYEIQKSELLDVWGIPMSQLYSLLKRLEREEKVQVIRKVQANRPGKKVYRLTEEGRKAFLAWVQRPCGKVRNIRTEFLSKLYFTYRLRLGIGRRLVREQVKVCRKRREILAQRARKPDAFEETIRRYRFAMIDATIRWLETCGELFEGVENES